MVGLALGIQIMAMPSAQMLSCTCASCHGTNGVSNAPVISSLTDLSKNYLVEAMQAYKNDERSSTIMNRIVKGYNDKEFELIGEFFSEQKMHSIDKQSYDNAKEKAGKKLHKKYYSSCHSEGSTVTDDEVGLLAGNAALFMKYSLVDFHDGSRDMPKKMKKKSKKC